ncbi:MAG: Hpt domain-containing protein [Flavobacteriaceae bacterium]|nr:Hpt domain-containing protein [Flavobacteriaceae bacterium]
MPIRQADYTNLDHAEIAASIGLNIKHIPILIDSFLSESNGAITKLQDAIEKKTFHDISENAHFIKGSAGNLKFDEIYTMAQEMELNANESNSDFDYIGYCEAIKQALLTI